jgi:hypothetical protein
MAEIRCSKCYGQLNTGYVCTCCGHHDPPQHTFSSDNTWAHPCAAIKEVSASEAQQRITELEAALTRIGSAIANDGWAATFQTLGQYRSALLKELAEVLHA